MSLRNKTLTVRRMTGGAYTDGIWSGQAEGESFTIRCSIQPLTPAQMQALPEGRREIQSFSIFTSTQLNTVDTQNPDRIAVYGVECEVFSCAPWRNGIISHFEAIVQKVQAEPAAT